MRIGLLGWGSLIWDSKELNLPETSWHQDGPELPIEFARKSTKGRLTLVIYPGARLVPVLWAEMHQTQLDAAIEALRNRECTSIDNIGYIAGDTKHSKFTNILDTLRMWLTNHPYDALLWTDLNSNFDEYDEATVSNYLRTEADKAECRKYIDKAPKQIDTDMRRTIVNSGVLN